MSASGRYVIVYNGEIYNAMDIRSSLFQGGARLRGHSDTEVLLEAISQWGIRYSLRAVVGMFAFALWDRQERRLTLARDRFGEKPLHWSRTGGSILFASELTALRLHPSWSGTIDRVALHGYLRLGWISTPRTIFNEAKKVPPATLLTFDQHGQLLQEETYWSVAEAVRHGEASSLEGASTKEIDATVEATLIQAIRSQLVADVPVGAFLSGGIDSSLITALAQASSSAPIRTFTIGFQERAYDETQHALSVARHIGADHTDLQISPRQALDVVPELPRIFGEPFADTSQIPTILVSRLARQSVTVVLSGDGGDELFGGYERYRDNLRVRGLIQDLPPALRRPLSQLIMAAPPGSWNLLARGIAPLLPPRLRSPLLEPKLRTVAPCLDASGDELYLGQFSSWMEPDALMVRPPHEWESLHLPAALEWVHDPVTRMMLIDTLHYLPDDILVKVDRAAMAASLETRAPLLDHRVFELASRLPLEETYANGQGKLVLKRILARYVPTALTDRPKMGFGVPIAEWLRGPLRSWAEDLLSSEMLRKDDLLRPQPIQLAWEEHLSGHADHAQAIWNVLMFQAWLQEI